MKIELTKEEIKLVADALTFEAVYGVSSLDKGKILMELREKILKQEET